MIIELYYADADKMIIVDSHGLFRFYLLCSVLSTSLSAGSLSLSVFLVSVGLTVCVVWLVALCGVCGWCQRKLVSDVTS